MDDRFSELMVFHRSHFLGWLNLPEEITDHQLAVMEEAAVQLRENSELLVVVGIGGSYLGARAVNDALAHSFEHLKRKRQAPRMISAGHNIGEDYLFELLEILDEINYAISYRMLSPEVVVQGLKAKPEMVHVVLTGRNAHPAIVELADLVTEMREVKHPYQLGISAQRGIEY